MAIKKSISVKELSKEASKDLDETLLRLWNASIDNVTDPSDILRGANLKRAKKALNIPRSRDLRSQKYWQSVFELGRDQFNSLLSDLGIKVSADAKTLPKGSVKKLKKELRKKNIPPKIFVEEVPEKVPSGNEQPFKWQLIGSQRDIRMISPDEVIAIHWALAKDFAKHFDQIEPAGVSSENLLNSAVFRPQTSIGNKLKYPTVEMAGAALLHSIVHDHAFYNGNKRTALVSMLVFLNENGLMLTCDEDSLFKFVLRVAQHRIT